MKRVCPQHRAAVLAENLESDGWTCPRGHPADRWLIVDDEGQIVAAADRVHGPVVVADAYRLDALRPYLRVRSDAVARRSRRAGAA